MIILLMSCLVQSIKNTNNVLPETDTSDPLIEDTAGPLDTGGINQAPTVTVTIDPSEGYYLGGYVNCIVTAEDIEDGDLSPTVSWLYNNTELPTTDLELYINPNTMVLNDQISCSATAVDSEGLEGSDSQSFLVEAKPISIDTIEIEDSNTDGEIFNDETVNCVSSVVESEDLVEQTYEWQLNGAALPDMTSALDLETTGAMPGDTLACTVSVNNGDLGGSNMATAEVIIDNRPPSEPTVTISPANPRSDEDLLCEAEAIDLDGETLQFTFEWSDGNASISGAALGSNYISGGDEWLCQVYAQDALSQSETGYASVNVLPECTTSSSGSDTLTLGLGVNMTLNLIQGCEDPLQRYELTHSYYMMTTEVTQGMFVAVLGGNPVGPSSSGGYGDDYPAYYADWHVAANFANAVTAIHNSVHGTSLQSCYSCSGSDPFGAMSCTYAMNPYQCDGYSLPTAAEWEFAARAGTAEDFWTGNGGNLGGNVLDQLSCGNGTDDTTILIDDGVNNPPLSDYAWFCGNEDNQTYPGTSKPVGLKLPNGFGLYDMVGNLKEWVTDDDTQVYPAANVNPVSMGSSGTKLMMNGNWFGNASSLGLGDYVTYNGTMDFTGTGFRLRRLVP